MQKQLDTISKLTGKVEHYEMELKIAEDRCVAVNAQLETQVILCRDREKQVLQLQEEVNEKQCCSIVMYRVFSQRVVKNALFFQLEAKEERISAYSHDTEGLKHQLFQKEKQWTELQDKFMQSSTHIMEETIG